MAGPTVTASGARTLLAAAAEPIEPRCPELGLCRGEHIGGRTHNGGIRATLHLSPVLTARSQPFEVASKSGAHLGLVALLLHADLVPRAGRISFPRRASMSSPAHSGGSAT